MPKFRKNRLGKARKKYTADCPIQEQHLNVLAQMLEKKYDARVTIENLSSNHQANNSSSIPLLDSLVARGGMSPEKVIAEFMDKNADNFSNALNNDNENQKNTNKKNYRLKLMFSPGPAAKPVPIKITISPRPQPAPRNTPKPWPN